MPNQYKSLRSLKTAARRLIFCLTTIKGKGCNLMKQIVYNYFSPSLQPYSPTGSYLTPQHRLYCRPLPFSSQPSPCTRRLFPSATPDCPRRIHPSPSCTNEAFPNSNQSATPIGKTKTPRKIARRSSLQHELVGDSGLEPPTPCMSSKCSNQLS